MRRQLIFILVPHFILFPYFYFIFILPSLLFYPVKICATGTRHLRELTLLYTAVTITVPIIISQFAIGM
jgi:hypothetical protein